MFSEVGLGLWSGAGLAWWSISWQLVAAESERNSENCLPAANGEPLLSIFKPLPALGAAGLDPLISGLESFISQLDPQSELLLGILEADRTSTSAFVQRMRTEYPGAQLKIIFRAERDEFPNPKIAWQKILAPHAEGELWLWSDADIVAPVGFLRRARDEFSRGETMLTFPYVVRETAGGPSLLDALFVNAEFHPGVLLLRKFGPVDFALGAGMLFRRDNFLRRVPWEEIGSALADDFVLGQKLGPVRISTLTLSTAAEASTWPEAVQHYFRWSKTIRWNRPLGFAARLSVLPLAGWIIGVIVHPAVPWTWVGLFLMMQVDVLFAGLICRQAGCRLRVRDLPVLELWSIGRIVVWLLCWLPWPVVWRGRSWHGPKTASRPG